MRVGRHRPAPVALPPGKEIRYTLYRWLVTPHLRPWTDAENLDPHRDSNHGPWRVTVQTSLSRPTDSVVAFKVD